MKKILFIINPISGVGKQKIVENLIDKVLDLQQFTYDISYTQYAKHAIEISIEAAPKYDVLVAVGGDGTANEISHGLIGTDTHLAIIPTGSGNGLARSLKIPLNIEKAIENINSFNSNTIDTATINDKIFVNVAGIGFDAKISHRFATYGKRGLWSYVKLTLDEFFNYRSKKYKLIIDGRVRKKKAFLISFANSSQFGNNAYIAPKAIIDDGFIDVSLMKKFPLLAAPIVGFRLFDKKVDSSRYVDTFRGKHIMIRRKKAIKAHIDGEPVVFGSDIFIKVQPLSLKVLTGSDFKPSIKEVTDDNSDFGR